MKEYRVDRTRVMYGRQACRHGEGGVLAEQERLGACQSGSPASMGGRASRGGTGLDHELGCKQERVDGACGMPAGALTTGQMFW